MENLNKWYFKHKYIYNYLHAPLRSFGNIIVFTIHWIEKNDNARISRHTEHDYE